MAFSRNLVQEGRGSRTQWDALTVTWRIFEIKEESFDLSHLEQRLMSRPLHLDRRGSSQVAASAISLT
jgi:hypothetical protein